MNPYAMQDAMQAEAEREAEYFARWCEEKEIVEPTDEDRQMYEDEQNDAAAEYWEGVAEDRAAGW